ncbi:MAG: hypothetical protein JSV09_06360 [Thermoplasmata archaeon]|nr:MAG: hypothetical protein JSV09_06360 [Thermoplasmata archaeon]
MKYKTGKLVCLLLIACMLLVSAVVVAPKPDKPGKPGGGGDLGTEYQITDYPGEESTPRIHGNIMVWIAPYAPYNIYMYYLGPDGVPFTNDENEGQYTVSDHPNGEDWPVVYGNKIVWRRKIGDTDHRELFMYHLGNDFIPESNDAPEEGLYQLTTNTPGQYGVYQSGIYENLIAYSAGDDGIVVIDLGDNGIPDDTDNRITIPNSVGANPPRIHGNKVIYMKDQNIHIYYLSGPRQGQTDIHVTPYRVEWWYGGPRIYENLIVWEDDRNSKNPNRPDVPQWINWDIYMYDLGEDGLYNTHDDGGEIPLADGNKDEYFPAIHGDKVVFLSGGSSDICVHDLTKGKTEKISSSGETWFPDLYGNHIIYQNDVDGTDDIYLYILNP